MRIALFTDTYRPTLNGVALTLGRLVDEAHRRGHEIALVTPRLTPDPVPEVALHIQLGGPSLPLYPELRVARPLTVGGSRLLEAFQPEVVHVATEATVGWSGRRWALRHRVPLVASYHTNFTEYATEYGLSWLAGSVWRYLRWFHGAASLSFCPSETTRTVLRDRGLHPAWRLWTRGVDPTAFSPAFRSDEAREALAPGARIILLSVGRLAPEKRCEVALDAFARLRPTFPDVQLVFVGDGPARQKLESQRIPGVHFTGALRGRALAEAYAAGDIFLFPSDTETYGNVVNEAFASGLPVLVADQGGARDLVVPGETGLICRAGDPADFARGVQRLLRQPELRQRMSLRAREVALERTWEGAFDPLFEGYAQLIGSAGVTATAETQSDPSSDRASS